MLKPPPTRLYFPHIPKTTGSSVTDWLRGRVTPDLVCSAKDWFEMVRHGTGGLHRYRLFCGHFGWGLEELVGRTLRVATVFRDPLERTLSHYRHVHRDPDHPRHRAVSRQSFAAFVEDSENWPMIENLQARSLLRNVVDPRTLAGRLDLDPAKAHRLATATEEGRYLYDKAHVRDVAHQRLGRLSAAWTPAAGAAPVAPRVNVAPEQGAAPADERTRARGCALTAIDAELYHRALAVSRSRPSRVPHAAAPGRHSKRGRGPPIAGRVGGAPGIAIMPAADRRFFPPARPAAFTFAIAAAGPHRPGGAPVHTARHPAKGGAPPWRSP